MKHYWVRPVKRPRFTGKFQDAHQWRLPGVHCPACEASGAGAGNAFPCADLSGLPEAAVLEDARLVEDFEEFARLREVVRPLVPTGTRLRPGTAFGPLIGPASGTFGPLTVSIPWILLVRHEALAALEAAGVSGLKGCRTRLRFRQMSPPELLELQIEPGGLLHPTCIPPGQAEPCAKCGRYAFNLPEQPVLALTSLPITDRDIFRLDNFATMVVVTERFVGAVQRLGLEEVHFQELLVS